MKRPNMNGALLKGCQIIADRPSRLNGISQSKPLLNHSAFARTTLRAPTRTISSPSIMMT